MTFKKLTMGNLDINAKWHVILTRPGFEVRVAGLLGKKSIVHYCPIQPVGAQTENGKKMVMEPLFKSYVFVHVTELDCPLVLKTKGVINFAYWMNQKAVIHDGEIETIRTFLNNFYSVRIERMPVNTNEPAKIINESSASTDEILHTVKAFLPSFGYQLITDAVKPKLENVKIIRRDVKPAESFFNRLPSLLKVDRVFREG